jgi:hypothetical protein
MIGATPEQVRDFHRAAAHFYRQAPWRSVAEGETIEIECSQLEGGPWYAVVLGKHSRLRGLMLFDDPEGRRLMEWANYEVIADRLRNIAVHFEDRGQVSVDAVEAVRKHGFEVAGPSAYPHPFRMAIGRKFRSPVAWELELLEACLWTIPDFLVRAKDRTPEVLEYAFDGMIDGMIGRMTLDLSWVPPERMRADLPENIP